MRQLYINEFEKLISEDINNLQLNVHKSIFEDFLYPYFGSTSGVIRTSFAPTYTGALTASIAAGVGYLYDTSVVADYYPKYRAITVDSAITVTFDAASTQDRIDLVVLKPNFSASSTANRYIKTGGTGPIVSQSVNKQFKDTYTLTIVKGTPGATPTVPATPANSLAIASFRIHANTGMTSASDVTDLRSILTLAISNTGRAYLTSTTLQGQLDQAESQVASIQSQLATHSTQIATNTTNIAAISFNSLAPTTTKGDIIVRTATGNTRLAVGANKQVPVADSTQPTGMKYDYVGMPTGAIIAYGGTTAPTGYLLCDGSTPLIVDYPALAAVLGTTYGGNGTTTFGVPDMRGRAAIGMGAYTDAVAGAITRTIGQSMGAATHLLLAAESGIRAHQHTQTYDASGGGGAGVGIVGGLGSSGETLSHNSTGATTAANATSSHNNMQPSIVVNYIIKT